MSHHLPELFVLLGTIVGLYALALWLLLRGASEREPAPPPAPTAAPPPIPFPAPAPRVEKPAKVGLWLVSAKGRRLIDQPVVIEAAARRAVYRHRTSDGQVSVFVADRRGEDGIWIYRRVGVERQA